MATIEPYETKGGKRYQVRYRTPDHRQTKRRGFRTKRDAEAFAATVEVSKLRGEYIDAAAGRATVGTLGTAWQERQTHLKPSSVRTTEVAWRVHVEPRWGGVTLGDIRHSDVQQWVSDMGAAGSGPVTVIRAYGVLAAVLDEAVRDRRLASNPARGVKLPRKGKRPRAYLSHAQVRTLAAEAGERGVIIRTLAYTGLRWGELAGLRVRDVDTERRRLTVAQNAVNVGGRIVVGTPKTHEQRTVPIPAFVAAELATVARGRGRDEILFPAATGGHMKPPGANTWWSGAVARTIAAADAAREEESDNGNDPVTPEFPRVTPHDMRHTAASLAVSAGANVKAVQKMLGHASAVMTLDTYADLFDEDLEAVATALHEAAGRAA